MKPLMRLIAALAVVTLATPALAAGSGGSRYVDLNAAPPGFFANNGRHNQWTTHDIIATSQPAPYQQLAPARVAATNTKMSVATRD